MMPRIHLAAIFTMTGAMCLAIETPAGMPSPAAAQAQDDKPAKTKREPIYDEQVDARAQITEALAKAGEENRRVLIQWGANWCSWCYLLHDTFKKDREVARKLLYEYDVVLIDIGQWDKNFDLAEKYGAALKANGVPFLTVLDAEGNVLANQETGSLEKKIDDKNAHDPEKVLEFLEQHQAPYLSAESMMADAVSEANDEGKHVFVHFGAPWCSWCKRLEAWLLRKKTSPQSWAHTSST